MAEWGFEMAFTLITFEKKKRILIHGKLTHYRNLEGKTGENNL